MTLFRIILEQMLVKQGIEFNEKDCAFCPGNSSKWRSGWHELPVPNSDCTVLVAKGMCKSCTTRAYHFAVTYQDPKWNWNECPEGTECDDEFCIALH